MRPACGWMAAAVAVVVVVGVLAGGVAAEAETPKCENGDTRYVPTPQAADEEFDSGTQSVSYQECDAGSWVTKALIPAATSNEKTVITVSAGRGSSPYDFATDQGQVIAYGSSAPTWAASGLVADRVKAVQLAQAALDPRLRTYNNRRGTKVRARCLAVPLPMRDTNFEGDEWAGPLGTGPDHKGPITYALVPTGDANQDRALRAMVAPMIDQYNRMIVGSSRHSAVEVTYDPTGPAPTVEFTGRTGTEDDETLASTHVREIEFEAGVTHWKHGVIDIDLLSETLLSMGPQMAAHEWMHMLGFNHTPENLGGTMDAGGRDRSLLNDQPAWSVDGPDDSPFDACSEDALDQFQPVPIE